MRGEKEQRCLERIRDATFTKDGVLIKHPFTGKTHMEISDDEFVKEQIWYINSNCQINIIVSNTERFNSCKERERVQT